MERGGIAIGFPCHGWLGEAGALWAIEAAPANNMASRMVTGFTKDRFIPQRVETQSRFPIDVYLSQRSCTSIRKFGPSKPDDSTPISTG